MLSISRSYRFEVAPAVQDFRARANSSSVLKCRPFHTALHLFRCNEVLRPTPLRVRCAISVGCLEASGASDDHQFSDVGSRTRADDRSYSMVNQSHP